MSRLQISTSSAVLLVIFHISRYHVVFTAEKNFPLVSECQTPKKCQPNAMVNIPNVKLQGRSILYIETDISLEECLNACDKNAECLAVGMRRRPDPGSSGLKKESGNCFWYKEQPQYLYTHLKNWYSYEKKHCAGIKSKDEGANIFTNSNDCIFKPECYINSWHKMKNTRLIGEYWFKYANEKECLQYCHEIPHCLMFEIKKDQPGICYWYERNAQIVYNQSETSTSYMKKLCDNSNPLDAIFIFNPQVQCLASKRENVFGYCKEKAWQIIEYIPHTIEYSNLNNDECIQKCQSNDKCTSSSYFLDKNTQETNCKIFQENPIERSKMFPGEIKYKPICCVFNKALPKEDNKNLIIADNLNKICRKVIENVVNKCKLHFKNVWERDFRVKMTNAHSEQSLSTVENCLNNCLKKDDCTAVSIDFHNKKCFHFIGQTFNKTPREKDWVSFFKKCCGELGYY